MLQAAHAGVERGDAGGDARQAAVALIGRAAMSMASDTASLNDWKPPS
jgi:hypothetical protein